MKQWQLYSHSNRQAFVWHQVFGLCPCCSVFYFDALDVGQLAGIAAGVRGRRPKVVVGNFGGVSITCGAWPKEYWCDTSDTTNLWCAEYNDGQNIPQGWEKVDVSRWKGSYDMRFRLSLRQAAAA